MGGARVGATATSARRTRGDSLVRYAAVAALPLSAPLKPGSTPMLQAAVRVGRGKLMAFEVGGHWQIQPGGYVIGFVESVVDDGVREA
jgi:hypothetical protein